LVPSKVSNNDRRKQFIENDIYDVKQLLISCFGNIDLKKIERPGFHKNLSYLILKNDIVLGHFGQLATQLQDTFDIDSPVYLFSIDLTDIKLTDLIEIKYTPLSPYPYTKFDLSFNVDSSFNGSEIISEVKNLLIDNENVIDIFDDFINEKTRNLGIRISTRNYNKTYNEDEVSNLLQEVVEAIEKKFSIKLNKGI